MIGLSIKSYAMREALVRCLRRRAPDRIPMSHSLQSRNYFVAYLGDEGEMRRFVVTGKEDHGFSGLWFNDGQREGVEASVSNSSLSDFSIAIAFYLREIEIRYQSPKEFLLYQALFVPWIQLWFERAKQFLFNKRRLVRTDRMGVLRIIIERSVFDSDYHPDSFDIMRLLYGNRWFLHPEAINLEAYYRHVLNSLVYTNDLSLRGNTYSLEPKALATLSCQEEEDRKHRDLMGQQNLVIWLTLALVGTGIAQALATWFSAGPR